MSFTINDIDFAYVNLDCRPDRNQHAIVEFAYHNLPVRRQSGFLTTRDECPRNVATQRMFNRTPGAIGCWVSQVKVIEDSPHDSITGVFEDDVCLCKDFTERIAYLSEHVPQDWDIIWLGATFHCNPAVWHRGNAAVGHRDAQRVGHRIFRTSGCWSTYGYLVHPQSRYNILHALKTHMSDADGIDDCMIKFIEPVFKTYCMVPGCCWQMDNQSNIGDGVTEFSLFKKSLGPYAWADRIGDFDPDSYEWEEAGYR